MSDPHLVAVIQYGALGLLALVLYFGGKLAKLFIEGILENQRSIVKELAAVGDRQQAMEGSIEELRKENATEHRELIAALRRLGGFRPSEREMPAVRPEKLR